MGEHEKQTEAIRLIINQCATRMTLKLIFQVALMIHKQVKPHKVTKYKVIVFYKIVKAPQIRQKPTFYLTLDTP